MPLPSDWKFQKMPVEPLFLVCSLFADFSRALGSIAIKIPPAPPFKSPALISFWEKEIQTNLGSVPCRGGWHHVQVGKAIFNCYICSSTHLSQPQPRLPPLSPLRSLSCTIGAPCRPCSPCSSCAIAVWATGYFLLGAKDYSVIRNVCLSGRLRNEDYK